MEKPLITSRDLDGSGPHWWKIPGSLRTTLLRLDGQTGAVVSVEKHVASSAAGFGDLAEHLGRLVLGLGSGDGVVEQSGTAPRFEPVKSSFTRVAGSIRRQVDDR